MSTPDEDPFAILEDGPDDDAVGYRRPPKATRFKKGQPSPNPGGRPKQPSAHSLLKRELGALIDYTENGQRLRASKKAVFFSKVVAAALTGGVRERQQLLDLMARYMPEEFQDEPTSVLAPDRQNILERLLGRMRDGGASRPSTTETDHDDDQTA